MFSKVLHCRHVKTRAYLGRGTANLLYKCTKKGKEHVQSRDKCLTHLTMSSSSPFCRASDIFQDWWARMTHGAKYCGSFSKITRPII